MFLWQHGEISPEVLQEAQSLGFFLDASDVLTLRTLIKPEHYNPNLQIRELTFDDPLWPQVVEINNEAFAQPEDNGFYRLFAEQQVRQYQSLIASGLGKWYLGLLNGEPVGSIGIFPGDDFYRYQEVGVRSSYRRQGIASTMIYEVAQRASKERPSFTQVIVADSTGDAIRMYRALGFETHSKSQALQRGSQVK